MYTMCQKAVFNGSVLFFKIDSFVFSFLVFHHLTHAPKLFLALVIFQIGSPHFCLGRILLYKWDYRHEQLCLAAIS
jgi:hypothetical protein